jgi:hypothetical protein
MFVYYLCGVKHSVNTNAHIEFRPILAYFPLRRKTLSLSDHHAVCAPIPASELVNQFSQNLARTGLQQNLVLFSFPTINNNVVDA